MVEKEANQNELIEVLSEILKWIKFIGKQELQTILTKSLKEDVEKIIFELSDGRSLREIEKICKNSGYSTNRTSINIYWDKWAPLGIVEPSNQYKGRYERIVSLKEVGIDFPSIKLGKGRKK